MHLQRVGEQQQVRELRIPPSILIPLNRPPLQAGQMGQRLL